MVQVLKPGLVLGETIACVAKVAGAGERERRFRLGASMIGPWPSCLLVPFSFLFLTSQFSACSIDHGSDRAR